VEATVLVLLVLVWAAFLVPSALRARRTSPTTSVHSFERTMDALASPPSGHAQGDRPVSYDRHVPDARGGPRRVVPSDRRRAVLVRRRQVLVGLAATVLLAFPLAAIVGGAGWLLFAVLLAVFTGYVTMLRRWKVEVDRVAEVLRQFPFSPDGDHPGPGVAAAGFDRGAADLAVGGEPAAPGAPPAGSGPAEGIAAPPAGERPASL
jgi:hypothetical protein